MDTDTRLVLLSSPDEFADVESEWNQLALAAGTPFLTHQWLLAWWRAFAADSVFCAVLLSGTGKLLAGALLRRDSARSLSAAANAYSEHWDVVAANDAARTRIWHEIGELTANRLTFFGIPATSPSVTAAAAPLSASRYRLGIVEQQRSPYLPLPETWDELVAEQSRNHRRQLRQSSSRLEKEGELAIRIARGPDLQPDLDRFLKLEASGWKGEGGTAIMSDPAAVRLYTSFAEEAAAQGWLRLHLVELDGALVAADLSCVLGDAMFLLKTCFDERYSRFVPGRLLLTVALRGAIEEGLSMYEFLGGPDAYKLRWGGDVRHQLLVRAYRGTALPAYLYRHRVRPRAARLLAAARRVTTRGGTES